MIDMTRMMSRPISAICALTLCFHTGTAGAQSYAALAAAFADAPLVARVRVTSSQEIKPPPGPDKVRYFATAAVTALVRAPSPQPPTLNLLADLPLDSRGKRPKINKAEWLIAARPSGAQVQLLAPPAVWSADTEARVRAIVAAATAAGAPGQVRRITGAFHSPGNVPGESETQIFIDFAGGGKGSLSVLRRPGLAPAWSASFGEVASDTPPPAKDTLGWFRLACGLPGALPDEAVAELDEAGRTAARVDYAFLRGQLGPCA